MANGRLWPLYPFSIVYRLITDIRNILYDTGILHSVKFEIPVICIGNITVGGTGKTPHTEYIAGLLKDEFHTAVLSRGYGRKTRGYLEVGSDSAANASGDEPLQVALSFPDVLVAVDGDRVHGVNNIRSRHPETGVILLDDAFQHRRIRAGLTILLTDYNRLMTRDFILPFGRLREKRANAARANIIIVTKCPPDMGRAEMEKLQHELNTCPQQELFFTTLTYSCPKPVYPGNSRELSLAEDASGKQGAVLVTGIASPGPLKLYLQKYFGEISHIGFPDHHYYSPGDIKRISVAFKNLKSPGKLILTTAKDAVRLREFANIAPEIKEAFFYVPVSVIFLGGGKQDFDNIIYTYAGKSNKNHPVP